MLGVDSASARPCFDGTTRGSSRISGLSQHVAVVNLALVCIGYIWRPMRDKKSSVCGNCCDAPKWTPVGAIYGRFPGTCGCVSRKGGVVLAVRRHVGRIRQQHGREC